MQCRAIARRCPLGSVTVLGDLAQATTPWAPGDWAITLDHLGHADASVRPLTAGYRVPAEVIEVANRLLPHIAPGVPPGSSIRAGRDALRWTPRGRDLVDAVHEPLAVDGLGRRHRRRMRVRHASSPRCGARRSTPTRSTPTPTRG